MNLAPFRLIHHSFYHVSYVIRFVGILRNQGVQIFVCAIYRIGAFYRRRFLHVVLGDKCEEFPYQIESLHLVLAHELRHSGLGRMHLSPTQILVGHVLVGDGLDHVGPGDKHVRSMLHHEDEIGDGR